MKKLFLSVFIAATALASAQTETGLLKVELSVGIFSVNDEYIINFERHNDDYYSSDLPYEISDNSTIPVFLDVTFFRYKKLEVGLGLGYQHLYTKKGIIDQSLPADPSNFENVDLTMFMFMPDFRVNWLTSSDNNFQLYSGLSFGINFIDEEHSVLTTEDVSYKHPTGHLNALGARFGNKFAGFMELGMGSRGFFAFGFSARFD